MEKSSKSASLYMPVSIEPPRMEEHGLLDPVTSSTPALTKRGAAKRWIGTLWPLILHCVSSFAITYIVIFHIHGNHFNVTERRPSVAFTNGTSVKSSGYAPLQSDITTLISIFLSLFRWVLATWLGALCWYSLFLLMEKKGLPHRDLRWMLTYECFPWRAYIRDPLTFFVGAILLVTTLAQYAAPVLTGSITWTPSNRPALLPGALIDVSVATNSVDWRGYLNDEDMQEQFTVQSGGFVTLAWSPNIEKGVLKRVVPSTAPLAINSTIVNMTLPYFSVTSIEWVANPNQTFTPEQLKATIGIVPSLGLPFSRSPLTVPGAFALIPEDNQTSTPVDFPPPSAAISETRTLVIFAGKGPILRTINQGGGGAQISVSRSSVAISVGSRPPADLRRDLSMQRRANTTTVEQSSEYNRSSTLPTTIGLYIDEEERGYAFARVTYRAGAGICNNCRMSSNSTFQNDTALSLVDDPMAAEAMRMMPDVIKNLVMLNTSIPYITGNISDYVTEVLVRSYCGAWTSLNEMTGRFSPKLTTGFSSSYPALRAEVNMKRAYGWLGTQFLVTILGLSFFFVQFKSRDPLTGDTGMVPFYLDTTDVSKPDTSGDLKVQEQLSIIREENQWKLLVDKKPC